ncbi:hypothetical protein [Actinomadura sp. K4S16]|uniref:hypothetical protein n=1 Tax=Actinomadura sp. K4S16 TaxID=1316147 RepID=UPI0011EE6C8F|nr:hypothetical protein [Actinomadura sp. K4S16]
MTAYPENARYEFHPSPRGRRPLGVDLHLDGRPIRRLVRLRRRDDAPRVIALLEDARRLGASHHPCDLRAEVVVPMLARRPVLHPCYSVSVTGPPSVLLLEGGHLRTLLAATDIPPGTTPARLVAALETAFTIGHRCGPPEPPTGGRQGAPALPSTLDYALNSCHN